MPAETAFLGFVFSGGVPYRRRQSEGPDRRWACERAAACMGQRGAEQTCWQAMAQRPVAAGRRL